MTAGHAKVAKAILVITSLCLYVHWHGSQTFTAGEEGVFRKEADLLVVSQAGCSMPRDIFWFATDFPTPSSGKYQGVYGVKAQNGGVSVLC